MSQDRSWSVEADEVTPEADSGSPYAWMQRARCRGRTQEMFPSSGDLAGIRHAKRICAECPVIDTCYQYAMDTPNMLDEYGIMAGLSPGTRKSLRSARKKGNVEIERLQPAQCGTRNGANVHRRRGEPICPACRAAENAYKRTHRHRPAS